MELNQLVDLTAEELVLRLNTSRALGLFAKQRAKFEGWLKVELIDILISKGLEAFPEKGLIDVTFDDVAIELKTVNTNYRDGIAEVLSRPITKNIDDVLEDINKHRRNQIKNKFIIFIVFPSNDGRWLGHLTKIEESLGEVCYAQNFDFSTGVSGTIYYGKVKH